ncbi:hypothetical protein [Vibrio ezurae]|uniref:Uncharacterized protein n=1 Tax=Vibrio ezurae NBRC 102218 TaxID=1219080 RepID=U3B4D0_9VIBR|nr:hypothetical protein [Vibrio ezurae]GAD80302.1 hypothetical protein VEZ01S_33_00040 [Vibrio ezurae NBRC 102218]
MISHKFAITCALCLLHSAPALSDEINLPHVQVLDNATLSELRGGFQLANDYIVDIGISISAAVNGKRFYRSTIANLVFKNGTLTAKSKPNIPTSAGQSGLVNIVKVGEGNIVEDVPSQPDQSYISQTISTSSLINIIQNTLDNNVLGLDTVVDIDARVKGINKQIRDDIRLKGALLNHHY